jgi:hypothetical protein
MPPSDAPSAQNRTTEALSACDASGDGLVTARDEHDHCGNVESPPMFIGVDPTPQLNR